MDITELVADYNNLFIVWTQIQTIRTILKKKYKIEDLSKMVGKTSSFRIRHNFGAH